MNPDISFATKSGHFHLLMTLPRCRRYDRNAQLTSTLGLETPIGPLTPIMSNIAHSGDIDAPTVKQTMLCALRRAVASCAEPLCASGIFQVAHF
jgi:hypothetical protein